MIKLYVVIVKGDPLKEERLATKFYGQRYEVLMETSWKSFFAHELYNIRTAKLNKQAVNQP